MAQLLLENGEDVNYSEDDGVNALSEACKMNYKKMVLFLLSRGANIDHRDINGDNRFHCKECDERFPRHPSMMPKKTAKFENAPFSIAHALHNTAILTQFREGIVTFSEAAQATTFSLKSFCNCSLY